MNHSRLIVIAMIAFVALALGGVALASALQVSIAGVGFAGKVTETGCAEKVKLTYGAAAYDATTGGFVYPNVAYADVDDDCSGRTIIVKVLDASNAVLSSSSGTLTNSGSGTLTLSPQPSVNAARSIAVVVQ